jgi:hypothetical protein
VNRPITRRVCAWCSAHLGDRPASEWEVAEGLLETHGVCATCSEKLVADAAVETGGTNG